MYSNRAFHMFSRFPSRAVAVILLPAVLVFMALGCGGGEPAPPGGDAAPESTAESRPREREPGSGSAGANTPQPHGTGRVSATERRGGDARARPDRAACTYCYRCEHAPCLGTHAACRDCHSGF